MTYTVTFTPQELRFENNDNDFRIYEAELQEAKPRIAKGRITVKGVMPRLIPTMTYTATVSPQTHPKYGVSYRVAALRGGEEGEVSGELALLAMSATPAQYRHIVERYPEHPVEAIMAPGFVHRSVYDLSLLELGAIRRRINENRPYLEAHLALSVYGISFSLLRRAVDHFGGCAEAVRRIKENPYLLCRVVDGIGWRGADEIAQKIGIGVASPYRFEAAVLWALEQNEGEGNTREALADLMADVAELLGYGFAGDAAFLAAVRQVAGVYYDERSMSCARRETYECECGIAQQLVQRLKFAPQPLPRIEELVQRVEAQNSMTFTPDQRAAIEMVSRSAVSILTGHAGTGKSSTLRGILAVLEAAGVRCALLAPTGKAAKVINQYTGRPAFTIHNALLNGGKGEVPELGECGAVVVDEMSMVDAPLFHVLLGALAPGTRLLMMGDVGQLPSISVGNLLADMIESGAVPKTMLTRVFRQAQDSGILQVATAMRTGEWFYDPARECAAFGKRGDCVLWFQEENAKAAAVSLYRQCIERYGLEEVTLITPMQQREFGTVELNRVLQQAVNPPVKGRGELLYRGTMFRVGDKVIHTKNDYEALWYDEAGKPMGRQGIFNGEQGIVAAVDPTEEAVVVRYDGCCIRYEGADLARLMLAYALTVHKMQGSSAGIVVLLLHSSHYSMCSKQLGYTALTRARQKAFIVAGEGALDRTLRRDDVKDKKTFLTRLLKEAV